jgi:hypothetical protein
VQPQFGRIIVADYLPSGFEIDNPRLVSSGDTGTLDWIGDAAEPVNSEFRDDRFSAAFERNKDSPAVFTVAYVVRAVSPVRYVLPQAYVEDMYRPDRFGRTATGAVEVRRQVRLAAPRYWARPWRGCARASWRVRRVVGRTRSVDPRPLGPPPLGRGSLRRWWTRNEVCAYPRRRALAIAGDARERRPALPGAAAGLRGQALFASWHRPARSAAPLP